MAYWIAKDLKASIIPATENNGLRRTVPMVFSTSQNHIKLEHRYNCMMFSNE